MEFDETDVPIYRMLGLLEVGTGAHVDLRIPPGRQQIALSAMLLEANRVVSVDHLIDAIWEDDPPPTVRAQVQICVSGLRTNLGKIGREKTIVTKPSGYLIQVGEGELDAQVFERLVADADRLTRADAIADAAKLMQRAIGLWRGPALSGITSRTLEAKAAQLDENRLSALETFHDLQLRLGAHRQLIGQLVALVNEQPLRERLRGQLMLALYRSGRQADALETYRAGRALLIDQLGLEPGTELRQLESRILAEDASLDLTGDSVRAAGESAPAEPEIVAPSQLPTDIADFTGRASVLDTIASIVAGNGTSLAARVAVLVGRPGVGKSAVAVHAAHLLLDKNFPDGQLYCDLGDTRAHQATSVDVLGRFLRALGIPGTSIPDTLDERAEMFRHLVARRRMVIVLDGASAEHQVRPLLPGSSSSTVIVTSRNRLTGLPGARVIDVDVFDKDQAIGLLANAIGKQRVNDEPAAAEVLVRMVGRLPLALRIVAARLAARPHWSLAWMVERLSDERRRLDELAHGELVVRASLALTYDGLEPRARQLLRLLSTLDGLSFPPWVAAALLDADLFDAADLLEMLVDAHMLEVAAIDLSGSPRYKLHELIRLFAREQLEAHDSAEQQQAARTRVIGGWLQVSGEAHRRVYGGDYTVLHGSAPRWWPPASYVDRVLNDPFLWLESEHTNLCSAVALGAAAGLDEACWDLAVTLVTLFESRCYFDDWERTHELALIAVRAAGNLRGVAALQCSLGSLYLSRRQYAAAERELIPALEAFVELGDVHGAALARRNLAMLDARSGDTASAMLRNEQALAEFREAGDQVGMAHVLGQIVRLELESGLLDDAGAHIDEALNTCRAIGNERVEVQIRYSQAELMLLRERYAEAETELAALLKMVRDGHDIVGESRILCRLGTLVAQLGRVDEAKTLLRDALEIREQTMDHAGAGEVRAELAKLRSGEAAELDTGRLSAAT